MKTKLLVLTSVLVLSWVHGAEPYWRTVREGDGTRLDSAVRILEDAQSNRVVLVGTCHMGSIQYFKELQALVDKAPCVLFECASDMKLPREALRKPVVRDFVAEHYFYEKQLPQNAAELSEKLLARGGSLRDPLWRDAIAPYKWEVSESGLKLTRDQETIELSVEELKKYKPIMDMAKLSAQALGLAYQMTTIRYDRPQFEQCDLLPPDIIALGKAQGADVSQVNDEPFTMTTYNHGEEQKKMLEMLKRDQQGARLQIAEIFPLQSQIMMQMDPFIGKVVVEARNQKVVQRIGVLRKSKREVWVIYGIGHLPELESSLTRTYGYQPKSTTWHTILSVTGIDPQLFMMIDQTKAQLQAQIDGHNTKGN